MAAIVHPHDAVAGCPLRLRHRPPGLPQGGAAPYGAPQGGQAWGQPAPGPDQHQGWAQPGYGSPAAAADPPAWGQPPYGGGYPASQEQPQQGGWTQPPQAGSPGASPAAASCGVTWRLAADLEPTEPATQAAPQGQAWPAPESTGWSQPTEYGAPTESSQPQQPSPTARARARAEAEPEPWSQDDPVAPDRSRSGDEPTATAGRGRVEAGRPAAERRVVAAAVARSARSAGRTGICDENPACRRSSSTSGLT